MPTFLMLSILGPDGFATVRENPARILAVNDEVEVRNHFDGRWARGFEITGTTPEGYLVRRVSDGRELPTVFDHHEVRPRRERKRNSWWY